MGGFSESHNAHCENGNGRLVQMIGSSLNPREEHWIEIIPVLEPGEELRIESVCVAGEAALVSVAGSA